MTPLDAARGWYDSVYQSALALRALGGRHWDRLSADAAVRRDNRLGGLEAGHLVAWADATLAELDDLAVLLLFSVFEAEVRTLVREEVGAEAAKASHPLIRSALGDLQAAVEQGGFHRVLSAYKAADAHLVEEVNQVRRYRNWVAHGRRGDQPPAVTPHQAHARLTRLLVIVRPPA